MTAALVFFVAWVLTMALLVLTLACNEINKARAIDANERALKAEDRAVRYSREVVRLNGTDVETETAVRELMADLENWGKS